jgi:non-specific serine/threonine protein kinase
MAEILRNHFEDGVWFVALASVRDSALVPFWIAQQLGLRRASTGSPELALHDYLRNRRLLLVIDNVEHLLPARTFLADLLDRSAHLKMVATSRAPLHVYGEHQFRVQPLQLVLAADEPEPAGLNRSPAVRLFVDRATAADASFALTADNERAVVEICQRLDGLPLALELAAARMSVLTAETVLERMDARLPLLAGGIHGHPERFRTMRSAIAWSFDLLSEEERTLQRRLSVFVGGFTIEAAAKVAEPAADASLFDLIYALAEKSLLQRSGGGATMRFSMLEVIREFSLEELQASRDLDDTRRRHADYYLALVNALTPGLSGDQMAGNLSLLEVELPNIRAAMSWSVDSRQTETALRLATDLYPLWNYHGHLAEGRSWLDRILDQGGTLPTTRIDGLLAASGIAALQGDYELAKRLVQNGLELATQERYPFGITRAHVLQGLVAEWEGDYQQAATAYAGSIQHIEDLGEEHWRSRVLALQAEVDVVLGNATLGGQRAQEALAHAIDAGHAWNAGAATGVLAYLALAQVDLERAAHLYSDNLHRYWELGDRRGMGGAIAGFAGIALKLGRKQTAARLLGAARATGDEIGVAHLGNKGLVERIAAEIRTAMTPGTFQEAWNAGHALGREWALEETQSIAGSTLNRAPSGPAAFATGTGLTRREVEVVFLLAQRLTDKEIAEALSISARTAMNHVANILGKLGLANRREVAGWARERGLI